MSNTFAASAKLIGFMNDQAGTLGLGKVATVSTTEIKVDTTVQPGVAPTVI